jgi:hypothetical protein
LPFRARSAKNLPLLFLFVIPTEVCEADAVGGPAFSDVTLSEPGPHGQVFAVGWKAKGVEEPALSAVEGPAFAFCFLFVIPSEPGVPNGVRVMG